MTLPANRDLWKAQNENEWQRLYRREHRSAGLTFQDICGDLSILQSMAETHDVKLCAQAVLYSQWIRVWTLIDTKSFFLRNKSSSKHVHSLLLIEAQQKDIYENLKEMQDRLQHIDAFPPDSNILSEFLMMSSHVPLQDIQRLAGRFGLEEAQSILPILCSWFESENRNYATWHAGQVLKAARLIPPTQLHGFHAIMIYHACLTLWTFVVLSKSAPTVSSLRDSGSANSLMQIQSSIPAGKSDAPLVVLNGEESPEVRRYLFTGHGTLALDMEGEFGIVSQPTIISTTMSDIFRKNYPSKKHNMPSLLERLVVLMHDLSQTLSAFLDVSSHQGLNGDHNVL
ncbi:hypothetical protein Plec18167_002204 [Paecilomyces lecythidis]|uniref:Uncharacterized protein n=1 Tax=Paecilomyces lecythidis TaxID=3004212 RepID=A0ABR3YAY5_9EURO